MIIEKTKESLLPAKAKPRASSLFKKSFFVAADGNPFKFLGNFFPSWSRLTSAATSLTGC